MKSPELALVTPSQRETLESWLQEQIRFSECLLPEQADSVRQAKLEQLASGESLVMVGEAEHFLVWQTGLHMEGTGETLSRLWAQQASPNILPELLEHSIQELNSELLAFQRESKSELPKALLEESGFSLHRYRLALKPQAHALEEERYQDFRMRWATELDRSLLTSLASNTVGFTLPPNSEHQHQHYADSIVKRYQALDFGEDSPYNLLIAEHSQSRTGLGYILLMEDDSGLIYLDDMAVKTEHWGRYIGHFMVRSAENLLVEHGYPLMYAEISAANRRSLLAAIDRSASAPT